jgi:hypothetical protein
MLTDVKIYSEVRLLKELKEGVDFLSTSKENIKENSVGTIIEIIDDEYVLVEFSNDDYEDPVHSVSIKDLELTH